MTIFSSPDPTAKHYWLQMKVDGLPIRVRITISQGFFDTDGTWVYPGMAITDFRGPPSVDWKWIDRHEKDILFNVPMEA